MLTEKNHMHTLYWEKLSGGIAPELMLAELSIPYEKVYVDMAAGEHLEDPYLSLNPTGQVPAMRFPDQTIIGESAALVLALGEEFPGNGLVPTPEEQERSFFMYWLLYMATTGYTTAGRVGHPERYTTDEEAIDSVLEAAKTHYDRFFGVVNQAIDGDPYFLKRGYSALDIYLTMLSLWHYDVDKLNEENSRVAKLCEAVKARPSYQEIIRAHALN